MHLAAFAHEDHETDRIVMFIEALFFADFVIQFITTFQDPMRPVGEPVRNHEQIAQRYLKSNNFKIDVIALAPLWMIMLERNRQRYFFILKVLRLKRGL